jgi:hypothetical protein
MVSITEIAITVFQKLLFHIDFLGITVASKGKSRKIA